MFLSTDENPNCEFVEGRIFQELSGAQKVTHVLRQRGGREVWCEVTGLGDGGKPVSAMARKVADSGEGTCYLVYGGRWGIRLRESASENGWDVKDPDQWGEAFLLLPADGGDLRFQAS